MGNETPGKKLVGNGARGMVGHRARTTARQWGGGLFGAQQPNGCREMCWGAMQKPWSRRCVG